MNSRPHRLHDLTTTRPVTATLRLLGTTDVHSNLLGYDYFSGQGDAPFGLARVATLIRAARAQARNVMLFDNGDSLQGTPMGDITAQPDSGWTGLHPTITAMNHVGYDAANLGNHEFNFGLDWLRRALEGAQFPFTCANIRIRAGAEGDSDLLPPYLVLPRMITGDDGAPYLIRVGVIGVVPPQVTTWDHSQLQGRVRSRDMIDAVAQTLPRLRAAGADIVVLLAHSGIGPVQATAGMENAALPLAALPGVDVIMAGHSHAVFPHPDMPALPGTDPVAGTLSGKPAVQAGFRGSHLGVLDLALERDAGKWSITAHHSEARAVAAPAPAKARARAKARSVREDAALRKVLHPAHEATLDLIARPVGHSDVALQTYLAMAAPCEAVHLINHAQQRALSDVLRDGPDADLPVLSAASPFKTGARGGPAFFSDVPAGPLTLRNLADLYVFPNTLCGVRLSGAEIREWLERAASCLHRITPGAGEQMLCNPARPGHDFDTIMGLSYVIDLSQPARYGADAKLADGAAHRIHDLRHDGAPLNPADQFILAINSFRAFANGLYPVFDRDRFVHVGRRPVRDILIKHIRSNGAVQAAPGPHWRFAPVARATALLDTGPAVRRNEAALRDLGACDLGDTAEGFARLRLPF